MNDEAARAGVAIGDLLRRMNTDKKTNALVPLNGSEFEVAGMIFITYDPTAVALFKAWFDNLSDESEAD